MEASKEEGRFSASLALALVKAGADPNAKCRTGRSVLAYAIQREEFGIALALLKAGADPRDPEASQAMEKVIREIGGFLGDKEIEAVAEIRGLLIKKPGKKRETL